MPHMGHYAVSCSELEAAMKHVILLVHVLFLLLLAFHMVVLCHCQATAAGVVGAVCG